MTFSRDDSPWKSRQAWSRGALLWRTLDLVMDWIVYSHYTLRRRESALRPATSAALNQTLRYVKGIAVFWDRWLMATYPNEKVPASLPQPHDNDSDLSAGHAGASPVEHERG